MRPRLWQVRLEGRYPDWRIDYVAEAVHGYTSGWYAVHRAGRDAVYAPSPQALRVALRLRERSS